MLQVSRAVGPRQWLSQPRTMSPEMSRQLRDLLQRQQIKNKLEAERQWGQGNKATHSLLDCTSNGSSWHFCFFFVNIGFRYDKTKFNTRPILFPVSIFTVIKSVNNYWNWLFEWLWFSWDFILWVSSYEAGLCNQYGKLIVKEWYHRSWRGHPKCSVPPPPSSTQKPVLTCQWFSD